MPANKEQETRNTDDFGSEVQTDGMDVTSTNNRASTEAGAMRGMARSIQTVLVRQKQLFKFPGMKMMRRFPTPKAGAATTTTTPLPSSLSNIRIRVPKNIPKKLPKPRGGTASKSIPVRQAAKLSHGVSSGLDVPETKQQDSTQVSMRLSRALSFATTMLKNTLLGAAVFETYCYTVESFAPLAKNGSSASTMIRNNDDDNDDRHDDVDHFTKCSDAFSRASPALHAMSGALGGAVHGIVGTLLESSTATARDMTTTTTTMNRFWITSTTILPRMTLHHGISHAGLFGSYEIWKRQLLQIFSGWDSSKSSLPTMQDGSATASYSYTPFGTAVVVAGGLAGQVQYVLGHYTEQWLQVEENAVVAVGMETTTAGALKFRPPALRSVLVAFPASAIVFVTFEYARSLGSTS